MMVVLKRHTYTGSCSVVEVTVTTGESEARLRHLLMVKQKSTNLHDQYTSRYKCTYLQYVLG